MKKPYILFAAILVVLILAFTFSSSYLSSLEKESKNKTDETVTKSDLEQFKQEVEQRIGESESAFLARLDSLEQRFRESTPDTAASPAPTESLSSTPPTTSHNIDTAMSTGYVPNDQENEIYLKYLKRRWALPPDLTVYELKIAKNEIMTDVGNSYNMSAEEVLQLIDRVYDYRKARKQK